MAQEKGQPEVTVCRRCCWISTLVALVPEATAWMGQQSVGLVKVQALVDMRVSSKQSGS